MQFTDNVIKENIIFIGESLKDFKKMLSFGNFS
jgi:hypothetical protein